MYMHFPSPPPWLIGNWQVTANVWHNCVFPVQNSPNTSVIEPVSMPPPSNSSNLRKPVVKYTSSVHLRWWSDADRKPNGTYFPASSNILSTLASENPLISLKWVRKHIWFSFIENWKSFTKFKENVRCMRRLCFWATTENSWHSRCKWLYSQHTKKTLENSSSIYLHQNFPWHKHQRIHGVKTFCLKCFYFSGSDHLFKCKQNTMKEWICFNRALIVYMLFHCQITRTQTHTITNCREMSYLVCSNFISDSIKCVCSSVHEMMYWNCVLSFW